MLRRIHIWGSCALVVMLVACGGNRPTEPLPSAPTQVFVAPGTIPTIITWVHEGTNTIAHAVFREPRDGSSGRAEIARVPVRQGHRVYSHHDDEVADETAFRYSVAAVGANGMSAATPHAEVNTIEAMSSCVIHTPSDTDSDGDGIPDDVEINGWQISVAPPTASATGISGQLQRDPPVTRHVTSDPNNPDTDGDGLCDLQEYGQAGTDPSNPDTDGDLLSDFDEVTIWNTNARDPDSDDDAFAPVLTLVDGQQVVQYVTLASGNQALFDGREVCSDPSFPCNFKTSPTLADTDGDGYTDYDEIIQQGSEFNPLIANLPQLELSLVGTADLFVNIGYTDSSQQAQTKSTSLSQGQSSSDTNYQSNVRKTWNKYDQSVTTEAKKKFPVGGSISVSATASFEEGTATTKTVGWSNTSTQASQQTYNDAMQTSREQGRVIQGGTISMGIEIKNTGQISYNLSDLAVTALQRDPNDPTSFETIATLELATPLGTAGISLPPGGSTGVLQVKADLAAGNVVLGLMANPASLFFEIATFTISNDQKVDFNFIDQVTNAQTGLVLIDFGDGHDVINKRVATNVARDRGRIIGITLGEALKTLGIEFETQTKEIEGVNVTVLTGVQDPATGEFVHVNSTTNSFWAALKTATATTPIAVDFEDIALEAEGAIYLLYVTDQDEDGLYLRDELIYGTLDTNPDTDGDGLTDFEEVVTGWQVTANLRPLYPQKVYSNPTLADADNDGLTDKEEKERGTDPNSPDTDGDLLCDGPGSAANPTGICRAGVTPDPEPLVPRFATISFSPGAYTITAATDATVNVDFSLPVAANSSFKVRSLTRGPVTGDISFSNGGRTITFTPRDNKWWLPGEELEVALSNVRAEGSGQPLPVYHYSFRAATNKAANEAVDQLTGYIWTAPSAVSVAAIVAGDFNRDDLVDIAYTTNANGASSVAVQVQAADDWASTVSYGVNGDTARGLVAGDFNGDGRLDLAAALPGKNGVAVLLASTTVGEFLTPAPIYTTGLDPIGIATADFNGDGHLDLVTANLGDNTSVLLGNGNGTFRSPTSVTSGPRTSAVAVADVNNDGFADILTAFGDGSDNGVFVNLGNGDGTFRQTGTKQPFPSAGVPLAIATGDFSGDGHLDVVTVSNSGDVSLLVNSGSGDGIFPQTYNTNIASTFTAADIMTADFNGNGQLDIAIASSGPDPAAVLLATENVGTFDDYPIGNNAGTGQQLNGNGVTALLFNLPAGANNNPLTLIVAGSNSQGSPIGMLSFPAPAAP